MKKWIARATLGSALSTLWLGAALAGPSAGARMIGGGHGIIIASIILVVGGLLIVWFRHYLENRDKKK